MTDPLRLFVVRSGVVTVEVLLIRVATMCLFRLLDSTFTLLASLPVIFYTYTMRCQVCSFEHTAVLFFICIHLSASTYLYFFNVDRTQGLACARQVLSH